MATLNTSIRKMPYLEIEVKVTITREFRIRMWIAKRLITLAAKVLGGKGKHRREL